ncbi:hypothetical protein [Streptomyces sp. SAJ15]|uniref:hypothetical protein n=1 Tax=Streptomyces sp. SAJ15 TaxID=2011095 RepID=UPI0011856A73|nr:hypothetical protein [Streptomyces sp. SAJ15]
MRGTSRIRLALVAATAAIFTAGASALPAQAATNPNPISWSIYTTFIGPDGEDAPLREGQKDAGSIDGFGKRHIESGHDGQISSWSNMKADIDSTLDRGKCETKGSKITCKLRSHTFRNIHANAMKVVFTERVDSRSHDHRPVGIITAYYYDCGC